MSGSEEEKNRRSVGEKTGFLSRAAHRYLKFRFRDYSIGHAQVLTLHYICRNNGLSQNDLGQYFNLDKSSVTSQISMLEKNGYLVRIKDKSDSRVKRIFITDKTEALKPEIYSRFSEWSQLLLQNFTEEEKEHLYTLIDRLMVNAKDALTFLRSDEEKK